MSEELKEALDPNTSPERLKQLLFPAVQNNREDILKALLENPNAPLESFFISAKLYPGSFFKNPSTLAFLKAKDLSQQLSCQYLLDLVAKAGPDVPTAIWEFLVFSSNTQLRQMTARLAAAPKEFFWVLAKDE